MERRDPTFLWRYMGGDPLLTTYTLSCNGMSLTIHNALVDMGANSYLFVNIRFGRQLVKRLGYKIITDFAAYKVGEFDRFDQPDHRPRSEGRPYDLEPDPSK